MLKWAKFFRKIQKPLIIVAAVLSALALVYALFFSTDIYLLDLFSDPTRPKRYIAGAEIYKNAQGFNQWLLNFSIVYILAAVAMLVFFTHSRRKYYLSNYITSSLFSAVSVFMGIFILINVLKFRADFLTIDMVRYETLALEFGLRVAQSTVIFDLGIALSLVFILVAAAVTINMIVKLRAVREEKRIRQISPEEHIYE